MNIVSLNSQNRAQVDKFIKDEWGGPMIVTLGNLYDSSFLPGFIALDGGQIAGAVLYRFDGDECEIAAIYSLVQNRGIGTALTNSVLGVAKERGCRRLWLCTTNDNTHAIRFYQKFGFALKAVHIGSFETVRRLKEGLPARGIDSIPIEHEFEFEIILRPDGVGA